MLGALFGGGDQLSFVAFDPGQANFPATETNKLEALTKALYDRPGLTLEINGSVDFDVQRHADPRNGEDAAKEDQDYQRKTEAAPERQGRRLRGCGNVHVMRQCHGLLSVSE